MWQNCWARRDTVTDEGQTITAHYGARLLLVSYQARLYQCVIV